MEALAPIIGWIAPILSTLIICAGQLEINKHFKLSEEKRSKEREEAEAKREKEREETKAKRKAEAEWRDRIERCMDEQKRTMSLMTSSLQSTMRATLIHNAEKYFSRGSITPEEHASWCDMHDRYSAMGFNGLIDTYRVKIDQLPHVTIESLIED